MQIVIDGNRDLVYADDEKNVRELLDNIGKWINGNNRIVTRIVADSVQLKEETRAQIEDKPLDQVATLEITTGETKQVVIDVLIGSYSYIPLLIEDFKKSLSAFRSGNSSEGLTIFSQCITNWIWINNAVKNVGILLKLDYDQITVGDETMSSRLKKILALLDEGSTAIGNSDFVTLADLLEYEIIPKLEGQLEIAQKLAAIIKAKCIEGVQ